MTFKMIVTDMDGTLLRSDRTISSRTEQALIQAQKQGVRLVLASGRNHKTLSGFGEQLNMPLYDGYYIGVNGAMITNASTMETQVVQQLQLHEIEEIYAFAQSYQVEIMAVADTMLYDYIPESLMEIKSEIRRQNQIAEDVPWTAGAFDLIADQRKNNYVIHYVQDGKGVLEPVNKICITHYPENLVDFYKQATTSLGHKYNFARTTPQWIEINPIRVSKGNTLSLLAERLQIAKEEILVFGDGENDLSMLAQAGYAVAMGNAMSSVKAVADYITEDNDHDGVAHMVEKMILSKK